MDLRLINTTLTDISNKNDFVLLNNIFTPKVEINSVSFSDFYEITEILPDYFLYDFTGLTSLDLSSLTNITKIGRSNFHRTLLKSVIFPNPEKITEIGQGAFNESRLESFDFSIYTSLNSIGAGAFMNCNRMKEINIGSLDFNQITTGATAFLGIQKTGTIKCASQTHRNNLVIKYPIFTNWTVEIT